MIAVSEILLVHEVYYYVRFSLSRSKYWYCQAQGQSQIQVPIQVPNPNPKSKILSPEEKEWDWGWHYDPTGHGIEFNQESTGHVGFFLALLLADQWEAENPNFHVIVKLKVPL